MRKLNQVQKDMYNKIFPWLGQLVLMQVVKLKLEYTLDEAINFAYDIVLDNAE